MPIQQESLTNAGDVDRRLRPPLNHLDILSRVGRALLEGVDLSDHLTVALRAAMSAVSADRGSVMQLDERSRKLSVAVSEGLSQRLTARAHSRLGEGIAGWVAAHREPVVLHGGVSDPRFQGVDPSIRSAISLPLEAHGRFLGVINLTRRDGAQFTDEEFQLARSVADLAALAIEKSRLYQETIERQERTSALLAAAIGAQEQERRRIAADIHDVFLQDVSALYLKAEVAKAHLIHGNESGVELALNEIQAAAKNQSLAVRDFIQEVRPPSLDNVGLVHTLREMVDRFRATTGIDITLQEEHMRARLPEAIETILYRTAQEALRNAGKHAHANQIEVRIKRYSACVELMVIDNGRGFELSRRSRRSKHYGLETMKERVALAGGVLAVSSRPGKGTMVKATIPLDSPEQSVAASSL